MLMGLDLRVLEMRILRAGLAVRCPHATAESVHPTFQKLTEEWVHKCEKDEAYLQNEEPKHPSTSHAPTHNNNSCEICGGKNQKWRLMESNISKDLH